MEHNIIVFEGNKQKKIDYKIKNIKYPFNGDSPFLIDKFLIFGYEKKIIDYTYFYNRNSAKDNIILDFIKFYKLEERPCVINEINNNHSKDLIDNELISELLFPKIPNLFYLDIWNTNMKQEINNFLLTKSYSTIFSINFHDNLGRKIPYNGLGYTFFAPQECKENGLVVGYFYVPMAYFILSEYPYFYHFNKICKSIYNQIKRENEVIPIEILLCNIIKYFQSPINKSIIMLFEGVGCDIEPIKNNEIDNLYYSEKNGKKARYPLLFSQLSGYPIFDFNLSFIFNILPETIIIQTFIFTFLEYDIIFYSNHLKILNLIMYIFSNLNYPFNDSDYYSYILSSSIENFMCDNIPFKDNKRHCMIGINNSYDSNIVTTDKIKEHFILDIDNKKLIFVYKESTNEVKEILDLQLYIKECLNYNPLNSGFHNINFLYINLHNLFEELTRRANKASINYKDSKIKPDFFSLYENESEIECIYYNFILQREFLNFIIQTFRNFITTNNINIKYDYDKKKDMENKNNIIEENNNKNENLNIDEENLNKEENNKNLSSLAEKLFKEKFKKTEKYNNFLNYCENQNTNDFCKIPYAFICELLRYEYIEQKEIDLFKLIDEFYGKRKKIDLEEIKCHHDNKDNLINDEEKNIDNIFIFTFNDFKDYYKSDLRADINREQEDDTEIFMKVKNNKKDFKTYIRKEYYLSKKLLKYYNNYLNNNFNKLVKLFRLNKYENKNEINKKNNIKSFNDFKNIENYEYEYEDKDKDEDEDEEIINQKNQINTNKNNKNKIITENNINLIKNNDSIDKKYNNFNYYILNNKNINKSEKDAKIFGTYEFMEIEDVIEKQLISSRFYSSYSLIKLSLLNILALTMKIKINTISNKKIIKNLFDFCEQTNFVIRKYIILYLNIFQNMKHKNSDINQKELDECINIILFYLNKSNIILKEESEEKELKELDKLNEKKKLEIEHIGETPTPKDYSNPVTPMKGDDEKDDEFKKLIEKKAQFFGIKEGYFSKNNHKRFEDLLKIIETIFTGCYNLKDKFILSDNILDNLFKKIKNKDSKNFIPKTPLDLYNSASKLLNNFIKNYSIDIKLNKDELLIDILSLIYYFKIPIIGARWIEIFYQTKNVSFHSEDNKVEKINKKIKIIIFILIELFEKIS